MNQSTHLNHVAAIVLAAGEGTRITKPDGKNKVTLEIGGRPMIAYTVENLLDLQLGQIILVVGYNSESVKNTIGDKVDYATQEKRLGTGHAVECGAKKLSKDMEYIVVLNGDDSAFISNGTFQNLIATCQIQACDIVLLTAEKDNPTGLGRVIESDNGDVLRIVEEKNATPSEKEIKIVNTGMYCFSKKVINLLTEITPNPVNGERYITDIIEIARNHQLTVKTSRIVGTELWQPINTDQELQVADKLMRERNVISSI